MYTEQSIQHNHRWASITKTCDTVQLSYTPNMYFSEQQKNYTCWLLNNQLTVSYMYEAGLF